MDTDFNSVMRDRWKQVYFDSERDIAPTQGSIFSECRIPVSGMLLKNAPHSVSRSFSWIISALPEQNRAIVPHAWGVAEVQGIIVPFDGGHLSSLGIQVAKDDEFRIKPFARILNQDAQSAAVAIKPDLPDCALDKVISQGECCISGVCYRRQKDVSPSTKGFEFLNWSEKQTKPHSCKGIFTSFIVKVEEGVQVSFWGAPIITADGIISSIVVHQREVADGKIAIVGMQIKPFISKIPLPSTLGTFNNLVVM